MPQPRGHDFIDLAPTHLEFIMSHRPPESPLDISSRERLGHLKGSFARAYPIPELAAFDDLLKAIDEADEDLLRLNLELR